MNRRIFFSGLLGASALLSVSVAEARKSNGGASYRSAKSGRYVDRKYAEKNKDTTVRERKKSK